MEGSVFIFLLTSVIFPMAFTSEDGILDNSILSVIGSNTNTTSDSAFENGTEYPILLTEQRAVTLTVSVIDEGTISVSKNEAFNQSNSSSAFTETTLNFTDPSASTSVTDFVGVDFLADDLEQLKSRDPSSKCPKDDEDTVVLFHHPNLPGSFYKCSHGVAYQLSCPAGLIYNPDISVCDWI